MLKLVIVSLIVLILVALGVGTFFLLQDDTSEGLVEDQGQLDSGYFEESKQPPEVIADGRSLDQFDTCPLFSIKEWSRACGYEDDFSEVRILENCWLEDDGSIPKMWVMPSGRNFEEYKNEGIRAEGVNLGIGLKSWGYSTYYDNDNKMTGALIESKSGQLYEINIENIKYCRGKDKVTALARLVYERG